MLFARIDLVLNSYPLEQNAQILKDVVAHPHRGGFVSIMIHEQYFYRDYPRYQADFEEKITLAVKTLCKEGRVPCFAEELCKDCN